MSLKIRAAIVEEKTNAMDSGLEGRVKAKNGANKEHDTIAQEIGRRCSRSPFFSKVKVLSCYVFDKERIKAVEKKPNDKEIPICGEIDVYAVDSLRKRVLIFEIKVGKNGYGCAENQLLRAEAYLSQVYPGYSFIKIFYNAKLEDSKLRIESKKIIKKDISSLFCSDQVKNTNEESNHLKRGKERKEYETVKRFRPFMHSAKY